MQPQDFLKKYIENAVEYILSDAEKKQIQHEGIETYILNKLNASKFKASATETGYLQKIKEKIHLSVMHELPIHITLPFGAAKNPYLPTAPGIDWAEVCNIAYLREYLKPIAKAYVHGVTLEYVSVAVFEEKVNKIPKKDTDVYDKEFTQLLSFYQQYLPANLTLTYSRVEDTIPREKINMALDKKIAELQKVWSKQTKEVIEYKLIRAKRNCIFDPNDPHAQSTILHAALGHDAFCTECWTIDAAPWDKKDMIVLGHNYTSGWAIHVRSSEGSSVNFWSGIGTLVEKNGAFTPTVFSPQQYKEATSKKDMPIHIFDSSYTNLSSIPVIS